MKKNKIQMIKIPNKSKFAFLTLLLVTSYLLLVKSPAFAQGTCRAKNIAPSGVECILADNKCEEGRSARVLKTATGCDCVCSLIPGYEGIDEFMDFKFKRATIGDVFSEALKYVYIFAGLGVFIYLIFGGFQLMTSGGDPAGISAGAGKIKNALIGFAIIFASYWLVQIIEVIFGMTIL